MDSNGFKLHDLQTWCDQALTSGLKTKEDLSNGNRTDFESLLYPESSTEIGGSVLVMVKLAGSRALLVFGDTPNGFTGKQIIHNGFEGWFCPLTIENSLRLRELLPYTNPSRIIKERCTLGTGDRLDIASPGHIKAVEQYESAPVLAQQSMRELTLTGRNYRDAVSAAAWAVFQTGYRSPWGADGDHLKSSVEVRDALRNGCTIITADISDYIRDAYAASHPRDVDRAYHELEDSYRKRLEETYTGQLYTLDTGDIVEISEEEVKRIALVYREAIECARFLYTEGLKEKRDFDFEVSIDETETPTSPQAHIVVGSELMYLGVDFVSLAPRFIGEFQKGIDYIGDVGEFGESIRLHASIARFLGGYKISVHSGSDKFSVFPAISHHTQGRFHLKTSGTSWLEALRTIAEKNPPLFRDIYRKALEVFPITSKNYHVTPDLEALTGIEEIPAERLSDVLDNPNDRRVLHIAYGEIFNDGSLRRSFFEDLTAHRERYWEILEAHFMKHLYHLGVEEKQ